MSKVYQVKVTIMYIEPVIWRRLIIPSNITFHKFHKIIQAAFGWQSYHLFNFDFKDFVVHIPDPTWAPAELYGVPEKNAKRLKIDEFMKEGAGFIYTYDFGDNWEHKIIVEKTMDAKKGLHYPMCLVGERHRPPEDVGGTGGYEMFLEAINDPKHPEYDDMLVWAEKDTGGRKFDPEYFYINEVNRLLEKIK